MAKAHMSIGQPVAMIPSVKRAKAKHTRVELVAKAVKKAEPGAILPVYTSSKYAAANLALTLRKAPAFKTTTIAVRKHIVYVQAPQVSSNVTETSNGELGLSSIATPEM